MKRKERELPGVLHFVVLNFQNQHFWLIRDHICKKKSSGAQTRIIKDPKNQKTKLSPKKKTKQN